MKLETIDKLCCPFDKKDLNLKIVTKDLNNNILEGFLHCNDCQRVYPIISGIPIMSPDEYRQFQLEAPVIKRWEHELGNQKIVNFRLLENN